MIIKKIAFQPTQLVKRTIICKIPTLLVNKFTIRKMAYDDS